METNQRVRKLIKTTLFMEEEDIIKIGDDDDLEVVGLNSVIMLQFIVQLEQEFEIEIDEEEIVPENFGSINKIVNYLGNK